MAKPSEQPRMETAGSLTPELEGVPSSTAHANRVGRKKVSKGGSKHERR